MASSSPLASILRFLEGPRDEERIAGLLLLAKREGEMTEALAKEVAQTLTQSRFLERLLSTSGDEESLSAAQRVGLAVLTQLGRFGAGGVLRRAGEAAKSLVEEKPKMEEADFQACLDCAEALSMELTTQLVGILASSSSPHFERALKELEEKSHRFFRVEDAVRLLEAATKVRLSPEKYGYEASLLSLVCVAWLRNKRGNDFFFEVVPELRSSEARKARLQAAEFVFEATPRLLCRGGAPEYQRDACLRLAALSAKTFGHEPRSLPVVARLFAAEARLALDEACALCHFDDSNIASDEVRLQRINTVAPLCLGFLERLVEALVGDLDSDSDSENKEPIGDRLDGTALLNVQAALNDAADAALAFVTEIRLHFDDSKPVPSFALALSRECFRYLGRLASDLDDDDEPDDTTSIHARLKELRPFVSQLISLDQQQQLNTTTR